MRLSLGKRADYSIRAVLHLARHAGEGRQKAREIAADMAISESYLPQILANLVKHDLVVSVAGPDGGYALVRPADQITLLEVIEAAEGPIRSSECVVRGGPCRWDDMCAVHPPWAQAQDALIASLGSATFGDVAAIDAAMEAGEYEPPDTPVTA